MMFALQGDVVEVMEGEDQAEMKNSLPAVERRLKRKIAEHDRALVLARRRLIKVRRLMAAEQGVGQITEVG